MLVRRIAQVQHALSEATTWAPWESTGQGVRSRCSMPQASWSVSAGQSHQAACSALLTTDGSLFFAVPHNNTLVLSEVGIVLLC